MVVADFMVVFPAVPRRRRDAHGSRPPSAGDGLGIGRVSPTDEGWARLCHKLCCGTDSAQRSMPSGSTAGGNAPHCESLITTVTMLDT